ncbi:UDP-N-acetylmuramate--L-alanyl-gamma-D-glutamyl-meso-2,6-diaminoheptandioate ligase [invertebrate metagenome]|uniref:UDP-N-acetylmuramate--L-alanyl-gamma-D-glutamyl-meso-2,6-diaminoheptandioate ligase n=1 Tax=invertebrate metagenome TaxID=1711999 RepID=A0A2H9TB89_9ZZZZ
MHIHVLGICGTFMGSLALLAREMGFQVSGSDQQVYPPMSTQLEKAGIRLQEGYQVSHLKPSPDLVIIGNALKRGNPSVEYVLDQGLPYTSGPAFFSRYLLKDRWPLAVAGTHGKTTTSSMLAWILDYAGMEPGFLIGGVPQNFGCSARLGNSPFFVVEADEYDTAFFDKRSKFVHYHPRTLIINNLEFDHADIFDDLHAIQKQFHHLVRTIAQTGRIIVPQSVPAIDEMLSMGCWSEVERIGGSDWQYRAVKEDGSYFEVKHNGKLAGTVQWVETGQHNMHNALAAIAAARHVGVLPGVACEALSAFTGVKRRMELLAEIGHVRLYDDFAHHPTAIATTLEGLRANVGKERIRVVIEPRSNTMKMGIHQKTLAQSTHAASEAIWFKPEGLPWNMDEMAQHSPVPATIMETTDDIVDYIGKTAKAGDHIVVMSNGGFDRIHEKLKSVLSEKFSVGQQSDSTHQGLTCP